MSESEVNTVLKVVLADQKKINAFLKKVLAYLPKDSTALEADHLAKKLDKHSMACLLIEAVKRSMDSLDVMEKAAVQIDSCKKEMISEEDRETSEQVDYQPGRVTRKVD